MSSGRMFTSSTGSIWVFMVFRSSIDDSGKVAPVAGFPLVVLLDQDCPVARNTPPCPKWVPLRLPR